MQIRVSSSGDMKATSTRIQSKGYPLKNIKFLVVFLLLGLGLIMCSMYMMKYGGVQKIVSLANSDFHLCWEVPKNLSHWIKLPSTLNHTMTDKELFWRASFVARAKKYPFKRVPKIAFMFLTKGRLPLFPLWEEFLRGYERRFSIYIHTSPFFNINFPSTSAFYQRQIPSQVAEWGKISIFDAERRLLANALLDVSNEWFVLLSESCIPLYNFSIVYEYLSKSQYSFVASFDEPGSHARGRYNESMAPEINFTQWRTGSQWFEVDRKLAVHIVADTKYYPKFEQFCKPDCVVDEHYIPTVLHIEAPNLLAERSITWADWSKGGSHPAIFQQSNISGSFLTQILGNKMCLYNNKNSSICHLFARRFDLSSLEPLLQLAPQFLGFGR